MSRDELRSAELLGDGGAVEPAVLSADEAVAELEDVLGAKTVMRRELAATPRNVRGIVPVVS
ncbi:MAG: hypothetical protein M3N98_12890 [Actinomycetota bacterium]|nr:hypothetical protein [Actinomycetota bacterium]